ncbi:hypothetical protein CWI36_0593p0010 [Hamiltosporidium magnivora]|uniref:Uncharacterized protein n=1 Tax=Hamiltosporidium magnivora TaxID=148818 RepID=A0A4Q9LFQ3_9MICR|nr:hypothetical protein CWI36_0593p0010 [Hamiltosporidium magnivora]
MRVKHLVDSILRKKFQPIYINNLTDKYDLFMIDCVDLRRYDDQKDGIVNRKHFTVCENSLVFLFDNFGIM